MLSVGSVTGTAASNSVAGTAENTCMPLLGTEGCSPQISHLLRSISRHWLTQLKVGQRAPAAQRDQRSGCQRRTLGTRCRISGVPSAAQRHQLETRCRMRVGPSAAQRRTLDVGSEPGHQRDNDACWKLHGVSAANHRRPNDNGSLKKQDGESATGWWRPAADSPSCFQGNDLSMQGTYNGRN